MKTKYFLIVQMAIVILGIIINKVEAFGPLAEPGPYFVRGLHITVPLRDDLTWTSPFGEINRNQLDSMRYSGKIYYPAIDDVQTSDQYSIFFPPDTSGAPYPVVIFLQGANVPIEQYTWLFEHIASYGYIALAVTEPGINTKFLEGQFPNLFPFAVLPGLWGEWQTSLMIPDVITYLEAINTSVHDPLPPYITTDSTQDVVRNPRGPEGEDLNHSLFEGMVDTTRIILGGHSMGGFLALMSASNSILNPPRPENPTVGFSTNIVGCFVYAAHTFRSTGEGFATFVNVPLLMLIGEKDGLGAGSMPDGLGGFIEGSGYERMKYTFDHYVDPSGDSSRYMIGIKGANHLSICTRPDPNFDRSFMDYKEGIISTFVVQRIFKEKITAFLQYYVNGKASALPVLTGSGSEPYIYDYSVK